MKKIILIILICSASLFSQQYDPGGARGGFLSAGIETDLPVGLFSDSHNFGIGFDFSFSYTDNFVFPLFVYFRTGYHHFAGNKDLYASSDYSTVSSDLITFKAGVRHYFKPVMENIVIVMPVVEGGISFAYLEKLHQFKSGSGRADFFEDNTKAGLHVGAGLSMFLLDITGYYNYFEKNQYLSFNMKITVPIYVIF